MFSAYVRSHVAGQSSPERVAMRTLEAQVEEFGARRPAMILQVVLAVENAIAQVARENSGLDPSYPSTRG